MNDAHLEEDWKKVLSARDVARQGVDRAVLYGDDRAMLNGYAGYLREVIAFTALYGKDVLSQIVEGNIRHLVIMEREE